MSTRASIIITSGSKFGKRIHLYHHHDGYPDFVGMVILEALKGWRGNQYCSRWWEDSVANKLVKNPTFHFYERERNPQAHWIEGDFKLDENGNKIVGERIDEEFEISTDIHGDIEYLYVINCKFKTIRCYRCNWEKNRYDCIKRSNLVDIPEDDFTRI